MTNTHVFQSPTGKQWHRPSFDLKQYLETQLNIPVSNIDPSGRFIHASRNIMIALYAIVIHFDEHKMRGFAKLLRHSSAVSEKYYSIWIHTHLAQEAIDNFSTAMQLDFTSQTRAPTQYIPCTICGPPAILQSYFLASFNGAIINTFMYTTRSIATQTGEDVETSYSENVTPHVTTCDKIAETGSSIPNCPSCSSILQLNGPYGSRKHAKYFGRYFLACETCDKDQHGRFKCKQCIWYTLGYQPTGSSVSNKPRNLSEIEEFIRTTQVISGNV